MKKNALNNSGEYPVQIAEIHQVRFHVDDLPTFLKEMRSIGKKDHGTIICFNREMMAGRRHVEAALRFASRSFTSGEQIARSIEVEALLYAAGTRQTGLIGPFGIKKGENECYLCIIPPGSPAVDNLTTMVTMVDEENWEEMNQSKKDHLQEVFGITTAEIRVTGKDRLIDLILERVALLTINR